MEIKYRQNMPAEDKQKRKNTERIQKKFQQFVETNKKAFAKTRCSRRVNLFYQG